MQSVSNHFDSIAEHFNRIWYFSDSYKDFVIAHILENLDFSEEDVLADIGGGTGSFTSRLIHEGNFAAAYCIEPSAPMCEEAAKQPAIEALCTDAHGFLERKIPFSKMLLKEVIHHISDRARFWHNTYTALPNGGKLLIITRPQQTAFPFFDAAKAAFAQNQPPHEIVETELRECGFEIITSRNSHTFTLPKESWYEMLRHRFMSDLGVFSDTEIEEGILEIESRYEGDTIDIIDHLIFITATKN